MSTEPPKTTEDAGPGTPGEAETGRVAGAPDADAPETEAREAAAAGGGAGDADRAADPAPG
ncbi:hypothetical protein IGX29_16410, partial [Streptomyces sp. H28]|uniref:hypothetical protein n=1 Tax=Streptomyces sp. H28 TaxID=2775865 RepID=UPI0019B75667